MKFWSNIARCNCNRIRIENFCTLPFYNLTVKSLRHHGNLMLYSQIYNLIKKIKYCEFFCQALPSAQGHMDSILWSIGNFSNSLSRWGRQLPTGSFLLIYILTHSLVKATLKVFQNDQYLSFSPFIVETCVKLYLLSSSKRVFWNSTMYQLA